MIATTDVKAVDSASKHEAKSEIFHLFQFWPYRAEAEVGCSLAIRSIGAHPQGIAPVVQQIAHFSV